MRVHAATIRPCWSSPLLSDNQNQDLYCRVRQAGCFAAKPSYMCDRCGCRDTQSHCEGVEHYNSGGRVMLPPGVLCSGSPVSPMRIRKSLYLIGAGLIICVSLLQQCDFLQPPISRPRNCASGRVITAHYAWMRWLRACHSACFDALWR